MAQASTASFSVTVKQYIHTGPGEISIHNLMTQAMVLDVFRDDCLTFSHPDLQTTRISKHNLRYVANDGFFIVSYCEDITSTVKHVFFRPENSEDACMDAILELLHSKYALVIDAPKMELLMSQLKDQPLFVDMLNVTVKLVSIRTVGATGGIEGLVQSKAMEHQPAQFYLTILDAEGIYLYHHKDFTQPKYRLMFWKQAFPESIENIKLVKNNADEMSKIIFTTPDLLFEFVYQSVFGDCLMKTKRSTVQNVLKDPVLFLDHCENEPPNRCAPRFPRQYPYESPEFLDTSPRVPYRSPRLNSIVGDLIEAETHLKTNEDLMNVWVTIEFDIQDIQQSGLVPATDGRSGGMDPDNLEHLKRTLDDVADQFRDNRIEMAVSRLQACKDVFSQSSHAEIRSLFIEYTFIQLLKMLYAKSVYQ